jgi:tetratricopeptide (TPR) repeat protein
VETRIKDWGERAFRALFGQGESRDVYRDLMEAARARRPALLTVGTEGPAILGQPWELIRDGRGPLAFQGVTIRRQLLGIRPVWSTPTRLPLRVLLIVSRPRDAGHIDPRTSVRPVLETLERLPAGTVLVDFCDPPTLARLEEMISEARDRQAPYHVVHFDGHGNFGVLLFEDEQAKKAEVSATHLGDLLARLDVPLVILEACRGADLRDEPASSSVAPALLKSGVGSVVAFSHSVHVRAAQLFVERFYQKLAAGRTVGAALEEARSRLHADRGRWLHLGPHADSVELQDWFIPQLYQAADDPSLFTPALEKTGREPEEREELVLPGFPPEPMYRFHGRALELLELERAFRKHPAVVLCGMGGTGKTALAREAAHWWVRTGRFENAVFCSFEQKQGAERVVQLLGQALEGERFASRPAQEQWREAVRLFRRKKVLLVWDNFESTLPAFQHEDQPQAGAAGLALEFGEEARAQVRQLYQELTSGQPQGRLLVTCRPGESLLPAIRRIELKGLARPDSLHLLAAVLDKGGMTLEERPGYERPEIDALLKMLDDHPLSISLVAPHFKDRKPGQIREEFGPLLERFADPTATEGRNQSLRASLEFSKKRLSAEAQRLLPYLAWFQGGVFESKFLRFAELSAEAWAPIRGELIATALVNEEEGSVRVGGRLYLRFHPTLPYAARPTEVPDPDAARQCFLEVYQGLGRALDRALRGKAPAGGMAVLAREEANVRSALALAFRLGLHLQGYELADTLRLYLGRAGRLRERDALVGWVRQQLPQGDLLDAPTCASLRQHAWSLLEQGQAAQAIQVVQDLLHRLQAQGLPEPQHTPFHIALSHGYLGRMYGHAGRPDLALGPLQQAVAGFEQLGEAQRGNLAATLGDLANALSDRGRFAEALAAAERGVAIRREQGNQQAIAAGLVQTAAILRAQQRYAEAEALDDEALQAVRAAGDVPLQGITLQHQGDLQRRQGRHDRAVPLYQQALALFQRAGDTGKEMQTCDLLGTAEMQRGQLAAAEAWYLRSRELAQLRNDRRQLAVVAHNLGILYQTRAEQAGDAAVRTAWLRQAIALVQESLAISRDMNNQVLAATSYFQLGVLHKKLQEWDQAESHLLRSLEIREALNHPDVWKAYRNLADVARGRGDEQAAASWQARRDAKLAEVQRLQRGEGSGGAAPS